MNSGTCARSLTTWQVQQRGGQVKVNWEGGAGVGQCSLLFIQSTCLRTGACCR